MSSSSPHHPEATPTGGKVDTRGFRLLGVLFLLALGLLAWRFIAGLGATTAMNDGYPFGLWIAFDVVTGTALACGGYAVAILVYLLNRGQYHPLVRPAILTSALGYTIGGISVAIDVGRPWLIYKVPTYVGRWNFNSVLLEVALCITAYVIVLWIEFSPALLERFRESGRPRVAALAGRAHRVLSRSLIWVLALGLLLPTMHQSSLGTMMLLAGHKLHPVWNTPLLPLLFLVGCVGMGYGVVVIESVLSALYFKRTPETDMLQRLGRIAGGVAWLFLLLRFGDLAFRGLLGSTLEPSLLSLVFWLETLTLLCAAVLLTLRRRPPDLGNLFMAASLLIFAGAMYRFNTYLVAFNPGGGWSYFPAVPEIMVTVGLVALEIMVYVVVVRTFPVLSGSRKEART